MHRRENLGEGVNEVGQAVRNLLINNHGVSVKWLRHSNPKALPSNIDELVAMDGFEFLPPQGYKDCLNLINGSSLVISDSGGMQEEAYILGVPAIVARNVTERPEAFDGERMFLVDPREAGCIHDRAQALLSAGHLPRKDFDLGGFGGGVASKIIVDELFKYMRDNRPIIRPTGYCMD